MVVVRAGGAVTKRVRIAEGDPDIEDQFDLSDIDPGVLAEVVIVCDKETIEREIARQAGATLEPRSTESLDSFRCETLSGLPVSPATVLKTLDVGHFRRMVMKPGDLDFSMSRLARFFEGPKRLGLQVRDRRCVTDGCGAAISRCEADHIKQHSQQGETVPVNGQMLCGPCHRHKTWLEARGHWDCERNRPKRVSPEQVGNGADEPPLFEPQVQSELDQPNSKQIRQLKQLFDPDPGETAN